MNRRTLLNTLVGGLLAAPLAAEAQPAGRAVRVAALSPGVLRSEISWVLFE